MKNTACLIELTQGKVAMVSPEDFDFLSTFKWHAMRAKLVCGEKWYAARYPGFYMHKIIAIRAGLPQSKFYDHIDRDGLNNRRDNLRPCTCSQNNANRRKWINTSSRFKGVYFHKANRIWVATIRVNGNIIYLGSFQDESDAHRAYTEAAVKLFGEFACP